MKGVLLLHDNARPHTSLRICEAIAKMGWTVSLHYPHGSDLAPSNYNLCGLVKGALRGCHFAGDKELKQFFDVLRSQGK
jgi:hypothetical protein